MKSKPTTDKFSRGLNIQYRFIFIPQKSLKNPNAAEFLQPNIPYPSHFSMHYASALHEATKKGGLEKNLKF